MQQTLGQLCSCSVNNNLKQKIYFPIVSMQDQLVLA